MLPCIECDGAPRDLGQDQGRALAGEIRRALGATSSGRLARLRDGWRSTRGAPRDLERFFPHLAERAAGLAAGAGVERAALLARTAAPASGTASITLPSVGLGIQAETGEPGPCLAARLALSADGGAILRRSRPQGGLASLEIGLAWWVGALAGVNAAGLAALALAGEPGASAPSREAVGPPPCRAPAALLVTQCLERFERVEAAIEWCLRRPARGPAGLLFADAQGDLAGVAVQDGGRQIVRAAGGLLVLGAPAAQRIGLEKEVRRLEPPAWDRVASLLATPRPPDAPGECALLLLPAQRRLGLLGAGERQAGPEWHTL